MAFPVPSLSVPVWVPSENTHGHVVADPSFLGYARVDRVRTKAGKERVASINNPELERACYCFLQRRDP